MEHATLWVQFFDLQGQLIQFHLDARAGEGPTCAVISAPGVPVDPTPCDERIEYFWLKEMMKLQQRCTKQGRADACAQYWHNRRMHLQWKYSRCENNCFKSHPPDKDGPDHPVECRANQPMRLDEFPKSDNESNRNKCLK